MNSYVTVDLGATSGRVVVGRLERGRLEVAEVHRFRNEPSASGREQHWDAEELFAQTVIGLQRAAAQVDGAAGSVGVTAWGVDVGLLDNNNELSAAPIQHYRAASSETAQHLLHRLGAEDLFTRTGVLPQQINTVFRIREIVDSAGAATKSDGVRALLVPTMVCADDRCPHRGAIDSQHYGPGFPSHRHLGPGLVECCRSQRACPSRPSWTTAM